MNYGLRSQQSQQSCNHSTSASSLHNCPSCRCSFFKPNHLKPPQTSLFNNQSNSSYSSIPLSQHPKNNIYVCQTTDYLPSTEKSRSVLFRSTMFQNRNTREHSQTRSNSRNNITFTYVSPSKKKQHHSIDGKFSTKQFKQKHFPFLESQNNNQQPQIKQAPFLLAHHQQSNIDKQRKIKESPYYATCNLQSPPKKHKVLRLSKSKSQKLKTISSQLSQRDSAFTISDKGQLVKQNLQPTHQVENPRITPISALWEKADLKEYSLKIIAQAMRQSKVQVPRPSIQKVQLQKSLSSELHSEEIRVPTKTELNCNFVQSNLTYSKPVVSGSVQQLPYLAFDLQHLASGINHERGRSEKSLNGGVDGKMSFWKQKSVKISEDLEMRRSEEMELGERLSEQLQLNFDYYCPKNDYYIPKAQSDRSVSMSVSLY